MNITRVRDKLKKGEKLRVLFLNDLGFQYGAGLAQLRQIQSFLLMGHEVIALCWRRGIEADISVVPHNANGLWLGIRELTRIHFDDGYNKTELVHALLQEVKAVQPDVVIIGNLHGARWPLEIFLDLRELDSLIIAYMHDCYLITGRCAYPGECRLYATGCDDSCPTPNEHPALATSEIRNAWKLRREIFCGSNGIPLAANSRWTLKLAQQSFKGIHHADVVYLGLDERLFKPINRSLARRLLGIPEDRFVILAGAVNVGERRKGWHIFKKVVSALNRKAYFLIFGENSLKEKSVHAVGFLRDYRKMALLYSAGDLFVATSLEEAFGQTICEAASCCLPVAAFDVGGISEVARHEVNARLASDISATGLLEAIKFFMENPNKCDEFGRAGRSMVESEFTLRKQGERWMEYLKSVALR